MILLALEDTTSLNYGHKTIKDDLGHITDSTIVGASPDLREDFTIV